MPAETDTADLEADTKAAELGNALSANALSVADGVLMK